MSNLSLRVHSCIDQLRGNNDSTRNVHLMRNVLGLIELFPYATSSKLPKTSEGVSRPLPFQTHRLGHEAPSVCCVLDPFLSTLTGPVSSFLVDSNKKGVRVLR